MKPNENADAANAGASENSNQNQVDHTSVSIGRQPIIELLDAAPPAIRRPLTLSGGHAYAAAWPFARVTLSETVDQNGKIIRHNPPLVKISRQLCVVRNDGVVFGDGEHELSELGFDVVLPEIPRDCKLWSSVSMKAFRKGERPLPSEVFNQLVEVIDRFIDFQRSLGDQRTMAEMVACYILATWFLDAFNVIGFLWPNGERGSGKTQLLHLIAELSYLGQLILTGGSYATLRDLADYGATLCFDDAENVSNSRRSNPDKRNLLLAGNRRGATVTVKESVQDGKKWQTRYVNAYCPRAFSAIRLPDPVLASRTIVVPLIRTGNRQKANADPLDYQLWPHDRNALVDNLWALAVANLPKLPQYEARVNESDDLIGRDLEPWRALLAVAAWLEDVGVAGLYQRMKRLAVNYQVERHEVETYDLTRLVIRALCQCLGCDVATLGDLCDVPPETSTEVKTFILTAEIEKAAREIAEADELDIDIDWDLDRARRAVGRTMSKLRFGHGNEGGTHRKGWHVGRREVAQFVRSFGLARCPATNVTEVTVGHMVTSGDSEVSNVAA
jgi:hypothetical protein